MVQRWGQVQTRSALTIRVDQSIGVDQSNDSFPRSEAKARARKFLVRLQPSPARGIRTTIQRRRCLHGAELPRRVALREGPSSQGRRTALAHAGNAPPGRTARLRLESLQAVDKLFDLRGETVDPSASLRDRFQIALLSARLQFDQGELGIEVGNPQRNDASRGEHRDQHMRVAMTKSPDYQIARG